MLGLLLLFLINICHSNANDDLIVDAEQGGTVVLTCPFKGQNYQWFGPGLNQWVKLSNNAKYENANTQHITIHNVGFTDSCVYMCRSESKHTLITLNVIVYAARGRAVELTCPSTGINYTWGRFDGLLTDNYKFKNILTSMISIRNVDYTDAGRYRCTADRRGGYGEILLNVTGTPFLEISSQWYLAKIGGNITIDCRIVDSNPRVEDLWWTDSQNTRLNTGRYSGGNIINSSLTITGVLASDSGYYYCNAKNLVGTSNASTHLSTGNKPKVQPSKDYMETTFSSDIVMPCLFDSYPEPTNVFWKKDNKVINPLNSTKYSGSSVDNPSLTIYDVTSIDSGIYICFVVNQLGMSSGTAIRLSLNESRKSPVTVPAVAGCVAVLLILILTTSVVVFYKRKRNTYNENRYQATREIMTVELHVYDETQTLNNTSITSTVYANASSILKSNQNALKTTLKRYDLRDFMHFLLDKSSLKKRIQMEYQLLNSKPELTAATNYETVDIKSGKSVDIKSDTATRQASENKSLFKKQDDTSGYIITSVPERSDNDTFWTMITECRAEHIVLILQKREKIFRFFPSTDVSINTSKFRVELSSSAKYPNNVFAFILGVWNKDKKTEVQVKLCKTTDWKVGEKHPSIDTLCTLLDVVSNQESGMAVFIGSTGVGLPVCGGFGVCHEVIRTIKDGKDFNILQIVINLKQKQPDLFQTFEDYNLCYKVIGHFLENEHTYEVID